MSVDAEPSGTPKPRKRVSRRTVAASDMPPAAAESPVLPSVAPPAPPPVARVLIKNLLPQGVTVSVVSDDGVHAELRIPPRGVSDSFAVDRITAYTRRLVDAGHVRLLNV